MLEIAQGLSPKILYIFYSHVPLFKTFIDLQISCIEMYMLRTRFFNSKCILLFYQKAERIFIRYIDSSAICINMLISILHGYIHTFYVTIIKQPVY